MPDLTRIHDVAVQLRELLQFGPETPTVLMLAAACWFAAGTVAIIATRRTLRSVTRKVARLEQLVNTTSMDLKTLLREGTSSEAGYRELQSALTLLSERQAQLELRATGGAAYEHAIDLARMGLSPEQLMRTVGLTRGEAELMAHLHRSDAAA
jgi:hypothetical protein